MKSRPEKQHGRIRVMKGDLTGLDFDLIVLPANPTLLPEPGLSAKVFRKAGSGLLHEVLEKKRAKSGEAVLSGAYDLPCKGIIHAVMPVCVFKNEKESELLASCYWNSLSAAYSWMMAQNLKTLQVAFPSLDGGRFGLGMENTCRIAVSTVRRLMEQYPDAEAMDVTFLLEDLQEYRLYKEEVRRA